MRRAFAWLLGGATAIGATGAGLAAFSGLTARRVEAALPPEGRFIDIAGNQIHYLDVGSGPSILMVHGLGGQMRNFTYALVERLKPNFRVVVIERPGAGYSKRARGVSARLGVQADVVAQLIAALKLDRPLLVGHSLGGALSLAVALQHPEAASGLALISPLTQPQDGVPPAFQALAITSPRLRRLVAWTLATPLGMLRGKQVLSSVFGPEAPPADFATKGGGLLGLRPRTFYSTSTDLMAVNEDLPGFAARYGSLQLPAGILFGSDDLILSAEEHGRRMIDQVPGLVYETIPGGHMIPLTQPDAVAGFIRRMAVRAAGATP